MLLSQYLNKPQESWKALHRVGILRWDDSHLCTIQSCLREGHSNKRDTLITRALYHAEMQLVPFDTFIFSEYIIYSNYVRQLEWLFLEARYPCRKGWFHRVWSKCPHACSNLPFKYSIVQQKSSNFCFTFSSKAQNVSSSANRMILDDFTVWSRPQARVDGSETARKHRHTGMKCWQLMHSAPVICAECQCQMPIQWSNLYKYSKGNRPCERILVHLPWNTWTM